MSRGEVKQCGLCGDHAPQHRLLDVCVCDSVASSEDRNAGSGSKSVIAIRVAIDGVRDMYTREGGERRRGGVSSAHPFPADGPRDEMLTGGRRAYGREDLIPRKIAEPVGVSDDWEGWMSGMGRECGLECGHAPRTSSVIVHHSVGVVGREPFYASLVWANELDVLKNIDRIEDRERARLWGLTNARVEALMFRLIHDTKRQLANYLISLAMRLSVADHRVPIASSRFGSGRRPAGAAASTSIYPSQAEVWERSENVLVVESLRYTAFVVASELDLLKDINRMMMEKGLEVSFDHIPNMWVKKWKRFGTGGHCCTRSQKAMGPESREHWNYRERNKKEAPQKRRTKERTPREMDVQKRDRSGSTVASLLREGSSKAPSRPSRPETRQPSAEKWCTTRRGRGGRRSAGAVQQARSLRVHLSFSDRPRIADQRWTQAADANISFRGSGRTDARRADAEAVVYDARGTRLQRPQDLRAGRRRRRVGVGRGLGV
ncbi:hypothetical protein BJ912DRAFT_1128512 [Pholiota molesta]|nr:hypothetical protein BJ912DRAFT_1128512 [Pholiota molesta]